METKDVTIYTVLIGDYDTIKPPLNYNKKYKHICFSDKERNIPGWEVITQKYDLDINDTKRSRYEKILPHHKIESEYSIYHDANRRLLIDPISLLEKHLSDLDIAMYKHPHRNCIYDEANAIIRMKKDKKSNVLIHMNRYRKLGFPTNYGLHAGGVILRRNSAELYKFEKCWFDEYYIHSTTRDQLSLDFARWITKIKIETIEGNYFHNSYFELWNHNIT